MNGVRRVVGLLLVAASIAGLGALTRFDYRAGTEDAAVRLAWRTPVPRVVECREPTAEEQAELPIHMRQDEICEGRTVRYRLEVRVDDDVRHRSLSGAAGARGDRPVHVFEELRLEPGIHRVRVTFERADTAVVEGETALPDRMTFDRRFRLEPRAVVLITYDPARRELVRREAGR